MNFKFDIKHNVGSEVYFPKTQILALKRLENNNGQDDGVYFYELARKLYERGVRYDKLPLFIKAQISEIIVVKFTYKSDVKIRCKCTIDSSLLDVDCSDILLTFSQDRLIKPDDLSDFIKNLGDSLSELQNNNPALLNKLVQEFSAKYQTLFHKVYKDTDDILFVPLSAVPYNSFFSVSELKLNGKVCEAKIGTVKLRYAEANSMKFSSSFRITLNTSDDEYFADVTISEDNRFIFNSITKMPMQDTFKDGRLVETKDISDKLPKFARERLGYAKKSEEKQYTLSIRPSSDEEISKVGTPIFWIITSRLEGEKIKTEAHNWSPSIADAYIEMTKRYTELLRNDKKYGYATNSTL